MFDSKARAGSSRKRCANAKASVTKAGERRALVEGNMLGLAALDLLLRRFHACMMCNAINIEPARMDVNDRIADAPGFGIPAQMIADLKFVFHEHSRSM